MVDAARSAYQRAYSDGQGFHRDLGDYRLKERHDHESYFRIDGIVVEQRFESVAESRPRHVSGAES